MTSGARAVLFDLDDTLLVDEADVDAVFRRVTEELDRRAAVEPGTVAAAVRARGRELWRASPLWADAMRLGISSWEGLAADFVGGHAAVEPFRAWAPSYRVQAWSGALAPFGAGERGAEFAERFRKERRSSYRLFPESVEVVAGLRAAGWLIGIVTNGPPDLQLEKLSLTGLLDHVDAVAISGEVGDGKPDAPIFRAALAMLGVEPGAAVMVGDSIERDMNGASALGIATVWRPMPGRPPLWEPVISSLRELPDVLAHM